MLSPAFGAILGAQQLFRVPANQGHWTKWHRRGRECQPRKVIIFFVVFLAMRARAGWMR